MAERRWLTADGRRPSCIAHRGASGIAYENSPSAFRLAKQLGVPPIAISEILRGRRAISPAMALRLSRFLGTSARVWMNLQVAYDLREAEADAQLAEELARIRPVDPNLPVRFADEEPGQGKPPAEAAA